MIAGGDPGREERYGAPTCGRHVRSVVARYSRWAVLHRQAAGPALYAGEILLNPVLFAACALAASPRRAALVAFAATCCAKALADGLAARSLRPTGFRPRQLLAVPLKDLLIGVAWAYGLVRRDVTWRGNRLRVLPGTRVVAPVDATPEAPAALGA